MDERMKQRCDELHKLGLKYNGESYRYNGIDVHHTDIVAMSDEEWAKEMESIKKLLPKKQVLIFYFDDKELEREEQKERLSNGAIRFTLWEMARKHKVPAGKRGLCRIDIENDGVYAGTILDGNTTQDVCVFNTPPKK